MSSSPTDPVHHQLADALTAVVEHERLTGRITRAEQALDEATAAVTAARADLEKETADVAALESFSPARIWATLTGERATRLTREEAERQAAEYAVARAEAAVARARQELDAARGARSELGDVVAKREAALAAVEHWHRRTGTPESRELTELALHLGTTRAQLNEVGEALEAAKQAQAALVEAEIMLGKARDWAGYDTFFGGGLIADTMKYDRVRAAEDLLRAADRALERLATELADVDGAATTTTRLEVSAMTRTFDMWFDNIFSDSSVRSRVIEVHDRTRDVLDAVRATGRSLEQRRAALAQQEAEAVAQRERLLVPR